MRDIRDRHSVDVWIEDPRGHSTSCRPHAGSMLAIVIITITATVTIFMTTITITTILTNYSFLAFAAPVHARVTVSGQTPEAVKAARDELEFITAPRSILVLLRSHRAVV